MSDQKIHPLAPTPDIESQKPPPSAPLIPTTAPRSDNQLPLPSKNSRTRCFRFFCWSISTFLTLLIAIAIVAGIMYLVFRPKIPKYTISGLDITRFDLNSSTLSASFTINVTAKNSNKKIGIYYRRGSHLGVWFDGKALCEGAFPVFYQGHRNTTVINVDLMGSTQNASGVLEGMQKEREETGAVALSLRAMVPVRIKMGKMKLWRMRFRVRCRLVVDSVVEGGRNIKIKSSRCKFRFKL